MARIVYISRDGKKHYFHKARRVFSIFIHNCFEGTRSECEDIITAYGLIYTAIED